MSRYQIPSRNPYLEQNCMINSNYRLSQIREVSYLIVTYSSQIHNSETMNLNFHKLIKKYDMFYRSTGLLVCYRYFVKNNLIVRNFIENKNSQFRNWLLDPASKIYDLCEHLFNSHNIVFYFNEEFFHGKNIFCNIERPHGDQKRCIIQADKFSQDFSAQISLKRKDIYRILF